MREVACSVPPANCSEKRAVEKCGKLKGQSIPTFDLDIPKWLRLPLAISLRGSRDIFWDPDFKSQLPLDSSTYSVLDHKSKYSSLSQHRPFPTAPYCGEWHCLSPVSQARILDITLEAHQLPFSPCRDPLYNHVLGFLPRRHVSHTDCPQYEPVHHRPTLPPANFP